MNHHVCSKCGKSFSLFTVNKFTEGETYQRNQVYGLYYRTGSTEENIVVEYFRCPDPDCLNVDIRVTGDEKWNNKEMWFHPVSTYKSYPHIDKDVEKYYIESCAVLQFSPRASAALSRACLETVMTKEYKLTGNLSKQLNDFKIKVISGEIRIDPLFVDATDGIRKGGNASLHDELKYEISNEEALQILNVLEMFLDEIYVNQPERKIKLEKVIKIGTSIKESRNKK